MTTRVYDVPRNLLWGALVGPLDVTHRMAPSEDEVTFEAQLLPFDSSQLGGQRVRITVNDPHPLGLSDETAHKIVKILMTHVGETGESEGAVEVLERLSRVYRAVQHILDNELAPT